MIYGDNPNKINEREDALGLKAYTYAPSIGSIMQSGNLYVYGLNNPILYYDYNGDFVITTAALLAVGKAALTKVVIPFAIGIGLQFLIDVVEYKINNESGPEELFSSPTEYFASGVSNIVPGGHLWSGVSSAAINEAILIGDGILKNKQIYWSEHWNNLLRNTITNTAIDSIGTIFNKLKAKLSTKSSPSNNSVDSSTSPHESSFSSINNVDIAEPLYRDILSRSGYVIRTVSIY